MIDGWDAYWRCNPFGGEYEVLQEIKLALWNSIRAKASMEPVELNDVMSSLWVDHKEKPKRDIEAEARARYGGIK